MKKDVKAYDLVFPLWFTLYLSPLAVIVLVANFIIDGVVIYLFTKILKVNLERKKWWQLLVSSWAQGLVADIIGVFYLFSVSGIKGFKMYFVWGNSVSVLLYFSAIAVSGICIFIFNYRLGLRYFGERKSALQLGITMAVITSPYTFLIPTPVGP